MKRIVKMVALGLLAGAAPAVAQSGLGLYWDGCSADAHEQVKTFACDTNVGEPFVLYATIVVPADMPQFAAASVIVDVWYWYFAPVPPWWQTAADQCRQNAIVMSFDPSSLATPGCPDLWQGGAIVSVFVPQLGVPVPNMLRLNGGAALPAGQEIHVPADGTELNVCRIILYRSKTIGTDACGGCSTCAQLEYRESKLQQPAGAGDYSVSYGREGKYGSLAFWNGWCEPPDAAQNRSWGQIKGMYR